MRSVLSKNSNSLGETPSETGGTSVALTHPKMLPERASD
jgi:hypothetical protein